MESSKDREAIMESVLFTDHGVLVFVITGTAIALVLSVLGLATTQQRNLTSNANWLP